MNPFLLAAGAIYAVAFIAISFRSPRISLLLILAAAPFTNDLSGGGAVKFSLAEVNLFLCLPLVFKNAGRIQFGPAIIPSVAYILLGAACSIETWRSATSTSLLQVFIYLVITVLVFASIPRSADDYRLALNGMIMMCCFLAFLVLALRTPYILGLHKNSVGGSLSMAFVIAMEGSLRETERRSRFWYTAAALFLAAGCFATLSRGAWLAAICGIFVIFALRRQFGQMARIAALVTPILALFWATLPQSAKQYATGIGADRWNIRLRYESAEYAMSWFRQNPVMGAGIGLRKEYDATNVLLLTLAETGIAGVLALAVLHLFIAWFVWTRYSLLPKSSLAFSLVALSGALLLGKLAHGMVDHYWGRGTLTVAWATLGMAARASRNHGVEELVSYPEPDGEINHFAPSRI